MVILATLAIALIGVPHGGLDHWIGRRLLEPRFQNDWWIVFFPSYLATGVAVAVGWFVVPSLTVVLFFLASAWHFGREDQQTERNLEGSFWMARLFNHAAATAIGGLVIWVPASVRPDEFRAILRLIVPTETLESSNTIVAATQAIAWCLIPLASIIVIHRLIAAPTNLCRWIPTVTAAVAVVLPIILSFSLYFCVWHSWQGLQRLRRHEALSILDFARHVAPLSISAIVGVAMIGWSGSRWLDGLLTVDQTRDTVRTLFIGLSSIAVPHLILHEVHSFTSSSHTKLEVRE